MSEIDNLMKDRWRHSSNDTTKVSAPRLLYSDGGGATAHFPVATKKHGFREKPSRGGRYRL